MVRVTISGLLLAATAACGGLDTSGPEPDVSETAEFTIGTHPLGVPDAGSFRELRDGDTVDLVLGPQGALMAVLAVRTRDLFEGEFKLDLSLAVDGVTAVTRKLQVTELTAGGDGYGYRFDVFLIVEGFGVAGRDATLSYRAVDRDFHESAGERFVRMEGWADVGAGRPR